MGETAIEPPRRRVSWGAILAGTALALALYFPLTLLGGAIGLTIGPDADADTDTDTAALGTGAAIWAIVETVLCRFVGAYCRRRFRIRSADPMIAPSFSPGSAHA